MANNSIYELYSLLKLNEVEGKREGNTFVIGSSEYVPLPPSPEPEPLEGFTINLYKNTAENHRVDKTAYLTAVGGLDGALRHDTNLVSPIILIYYERLPDFNYVYIAPFKRYYYVESVNIVRTNLYEISLSVDVLMTYREGIKKLDAFIVRNEHTYNDFLIDDKRVIEQGYEFETITLPNYVFAVDELSEGQDKPKGSFVLSGLAFETEDIE
jgi:hypothetical protein